MENLIPCSLLRKQWMTRNKEFSLLKRSLYYYLQLNFIYRIYTYYNAYVWWDAINQYNTTFGWFYVHCYFSCSHVRIISRIKSRGISCAWVNISIRFNVLIITHIIAELHKCVKGCHTDIWYIVKGKTRLYFCSFDNLMNLEWYQFCCTTHEINSCY